MFYLELLAFFCFWPGSLSIQSWLSWNLLSRSGWPQTHRHLPASASSVLRLKMCAFILGKTVFPKCEIYLIIIRIAYLSDTILEIAVPSNGMDIALLNQKTGICWVKSHPSDYSSSSQWNSNYSGLSWALNNLLSTRYQHLCLLSMLSGGWGNLLESNQFLIAPFMSPVFHSITQ